MVEMNQKQMLNFLFSLSNDKKILVVTINGKTFKVDLEDGVLIISTNDVLISEDKNLFEFDLTVNKFLSKSQRSLMYTMFVNSAQIGKRELLIALGIDKLGLERLIIAGLVNGVFRKVGSQLAIIDRNMKEAIINLTKENEEEKEIALNPIDQMKEQLHLKEQTKELPKKKVKK